MSVPSTFLSQVLTRKLFAFAGVTLMGYDYLLTLPLEVMHIWNEPWTLVKVLFLFNRYCSLVGQTFVVLEEMGFVSQGSRRFCVAFQLGYPFFSLLSGESIRLFVVMRTCAILGCQRRVAILVNSLYALYGIITPLVLTIILLPYIEVLQFKYLAQVGLCVAPMAPNVWTFWFVPILADTCMLAVGCYSLRHNILRLGYTSSLIQLLVRDGLLFYIAALFSDLFCVICWTTYRTDPRNFLQMLIGYPFLTVVGQRLVLNLRAYCVGSNNTIEQPVSPSYYGPATTVLERRSSRFSDLEGVELDSFESTARAGSSGP